MNIGSEISRRLRATDELLFRILMGAPPPPLAWVFRATWPHPRTAAQVADLTPLASPPVQGLSPSQRCFKRRPSA